MTTTREALKKIGEKLERLRIELWACERTPNRHSMRLAGILNELGVLAVANAAQCDRDAGLEAAAKWHDRKAKIAASGTGGAAKHLYYAQCIRAMKGAANAEGQDASLINEGDMQPAEEMPDGLIYAAASQPVPADVQAAIDAALAQPVQAEPSAAVTALKGLHVGESDFEGWYAGYTKDGWAGVKQIARDAYAAGMEAPLVLSTISATAPAQQVQPAAFVPVHPRNGPLWANAITSKDQDHPRYPLMEVYTRPTANAQPVSGAADGIDYKLMFERCRKEKAGLVARLKELAPNEFAYPVAVSGAVDELPQLPDSVDTLAADDGFGVIGSQDVYTAGQMREYARAALSTAKPQVAGAVDERDAFEVEAIKQNYDTERANRPGNPHDYESLATQVGWVFWRARAALSAVNQVNAAQLVDGVRWDLFPSYLIDKHEGGIITEEGLQFAVADMLKDPDYLRVSGEAAQPEKDAERWREYLRQQYEQRARHATVRQCLDMPFDAYKAREDAGMDAAIAAQPAKQDKGDES